MLTVSPNLRQRGLYGTPLFAASNREDLHAVFGCLEADDASHTRSGIEANAQLDGRSWAVANLEAFSGFSQRQSQTPHFAGVLLAVTIW